MNRFLFAWGGQCHLLAKSTHLEMIELVRKVASKPKSKANKNNLKNGPSNLD